MSLTVYDPTGRDCLRVNPLDQRTSIAYDPAGRVVAQADAARSMDDYGLRCKPVGPSQPLTHSNKGPVQFTMTRDVPRPSRRAQPKDDYGLRRRRADHRKESTHSSKESVRFTTPAGQAIAQVDALNRRMTTAYDAAGRSTATVDPLNQRTSTTYNIAGEATPTIDPLGHQSNSAYDRARPGRPGSP